MIFHNRVHVTTSTINMTKTVYFDSTATVNLKLEHKFKLIILKIVSIFLKIKDVQS